MKFDKAFLENQIFTEHLFSIDYYPDEKLVPASTQPAAQFNEDGSITLKIGAPKASEVKVIAQFGEPAEDGYCPWEDKPVYGVKDENGLFTLTLPYSPYHTGSRSLKVYIDGTLVVWPYLPVAWGSNRLQNFIETPDYDLEFSYIKNVPHGALISQVYWSEVRNRHERAMVYTPPGYQKNSQSYPVLYLLHGGSDNETTWFTRARANYIFDNLIAEGKCVPFICVAINDMYYSGQEHAKRSWEKVDGTTEKVLIEDAIPFIEENYRVIRDKWHRALGGLSLGALQACDCGFRHPEIFGSLGFLTSILEHESYTNDLGRPWKEALKNPQKVASDYKVIFCSATPQEDHFPYFKNDERLMKEAGLEELMPGYVREAHDGRFTRWCSWRIGLKNMAQLLFRE